VAVSYTHLYHGEPDFAFLNIKDCVGSVPLGEYYFFLRDNYHRPAHANRREEGVWVEFAVARNRRRPLHTL